MQALRPLSKLAGSTQPRMQLSPLLRQSSAMIRRTLRFAKWIAGIRPFLSRLLSITREVKQASSKVAPRVVQRVVQFALPNLCALCGNMSHKTLCDGCDAAYWNEARLRCTVCAFPLTAGTSRRSGAARYRCATCRAEPPPFDATYALAD